MDVLSRQRRASARRGGGAGSGDLRTNQQNVGAASNRWDAHSAASHRAEHVHAGVLPMDAGSGEKTYTFLQSRECNVLVASSPRPCQRAPINSWPGHSACVVLASMGMLGLWRSSPRAASSRRCPAAPALLLRVRREEIRATRARYSTYQVMSFRRARRARMSWSAARG
jgi:hypothetical protein